MKPFRMVLDRFESYNRAHGLVRRGDSVLVALSGGPDSTALLILLSRVSRTYDLKLRAAHLNHGLSRKQAALYEARATSLCLDLGIPLSVAKADIRSLARASGRSIEEAGRVERYRFLVQTARRFRFRSLATAHTMDDQAETVLMKVLRGSGLRGLAGILPSRDESGLRLVRPLLGCRKKELLSWLRSERIEFAIDPSNRDTDLFRNRVRHRLLPELEKRYNPRVREVLSSLQAVAADAREYLRKVGQKELRRCRAAGPGLCLIAGRLERLEPALGSEVVRQALELSGAPSGRIRHEHIRSVLEMVRSTEAVSERHLPGACVQKSGGRLRFRRRFR